jgi:hypothetical protein
MIRINDNIFLPIPTGEVYAYESQFQELLDADAFAGEPASIRSLANTSNIAQANGLGLPRINYPDLPRGRLNSIIWPSGASRWARAYFVVTGEVKDKIVKAAGGEGNANTIPLKFGETNPISTSMYLLPPRPLSSQGTDEADSDQLWVIPLVDVRFVHQFFNVSDNPLSRGDSWLAFSTVLTQYDFEDADSKYLKPDWNELARPFANQALLADAMASSIGQRIRLAFGTDASCQGNGSDTDLEALKKNFTISAKIIAGNSFTEENSLQPDYVRVVFRKFDNAYPACSGVYSYQNAAPQGNPTIGNNTELIIFSTAYADFSTGGPSPDNDTILSDLAKKISDDYYAWSGQLYDYTFAGIVPWTPTGYDNFIEFRFGSVGPGGLQDYTRVVSLPVNVYADIQLSQDDNLHVIQTEGKLGKYQKSDNGGTDPWAISTTANVFIDEEGGFTIKAFNDFGDIHDLAPVWLQRQCDGWHAISTKC